MAIVVRSNPQSVFAQTRLNRNSNALGKSFERLSTGSRINSAGDDAAGLAMSTQLEHRIGAQSAAKQNALEGISMIQTAEGGVEQVRSMLDRMRELAVRSSNDTLSDSDRGNSDLEFQQLKVEITRIGETTSYNGKQLLDATTTLVFQVGMDDDANNRIALTMTGNFLASNGVDGMGLSGDVASIGGAASMLTKIDGALSVLNSYRSKLGSTQNRLERAIGNLEADIENATASNSRIRDVDFAEETSKMTRLQILVQSGTAILSQANSSPQAALSLLG
ncbi:MAG: flagellin [Myxococcota bacterium]|nr:flagellin [Myxococcota bacterium]